MSQTVNPTSSESESTEYPHEYEVYNRYHSGVDIVPANVDWSQGIYGVSLITDDVKEEIDNRKTGYIGTVDFEHSSEGINLEEWSWINKVEEQFK